jgi:hypothetical protein
MRSTRFVRVCLAALLATLLLTTVTAFAKDGRDFSGFYNLGHTRIQGDQVRLTLKLQVHNFGNADVRNAVISLRQNTGLDLAGTTKPIALLRSHDHVNLSQQFTISRREYESWRQGSQPEVSIIYRAKGKTWERYVQLAPKNGF